MSIDLGSAHAKARLDPRGVKEGAREAGKELENLGKKPLPSIKSLGVSIGGLTLSLGAVVLASKQAWAMMQEGAALELARSRFDNLSASIDTTGDALLGKLRQATSGMVSDAQLVASATDMISLGFAKTEEQAVRLTSVAGQLGWNMQQLTLTLANQSTMRLDSLGLSVEDVTGRFNELKEAGMDAQEAFQTAIIEAGEEKLQLMGSAAETTAGKMARLDSAWSNFTDSVAVGLVQVADAIGLIDGLAESAELISGSVGERIRTLFDEGLISEETYFRFQELGRRNLPQLRQELALLEAQLAYGQGGAGAAFRQMQEEAEETQGVFMGFRDSWSILEDGHTAATELSERIAVTEARARLAAEAAEAMRQAFAAVGEDYRSPLPGAEDPLVSTERQTSFVIGGPSADQKALLQEYQELYDRAADKVRDLTHGIGTFGMEQDKVNEAIAEANEEMAYYAGLMEPLSSIPTEVGTAHQAMTVNVDAARTALYDQAQAAGASAPALVALAVATGQMSEEQAEAALEAAALYAKIQELGVLIAGGMSIDVAMTMLDSFIAQINGEFIPTTADVPPAIADAKDAVMEFGDAANDAETDTRNLETAVDEFDGITATAYLDVDTSDAWTDLDTLNAALDSYGHSSYTAYLDTVINPPGGGGNPPPVQPDDDVSDDRDRGGNKRGGSAISQYASLGRALGDAMVGGIVHELVDGQDTVAKQIIALGNTVSRLFSSFQRLMPDLMPQIEGAGDALQAAVGQLAPFWSGTVIDNINNMDPAAAAAALRGLRLDSVYRNNPEAARRLEETIRLADERNRLEAEYAEQQKRILEYQERQAQLSFLQTQLELLQLIRDNGLDASLLEGLTLGLNADLDDLMAAMQAAMQAMITAAEDELQIGSPSKVMQSLGRNARESFLNELIGRDWLATAFRGYLHSNVQSVQAMAAGQQPINYQNLHIYGGVRVERAGSFGTFIEELYGVAQ